MLYVHRVAARSVPLCPLLPRHFSWYFKFHFPHNSSTRVPRHCIAPPENKGGAIERSRSRIDRIKNGGGYAGHRGRSHWCSIYAGGSNRFYCIPRLPAENEGSAQRRGYNKRSSAAVINHRISRNTYARMRRWRPTKDRQQTSVSMQAAADCTSGKRDEIVS